MGFEGMPTPSVETSEEDIAEAQVEAKQEDKERRKEARLEKLAEDKRELAGLNAELTRTYKAMYERQEDFFNPLPDATEQEKEMITKAAQEEVGRLAGHIKELQQQVSKIESKIPSFLR